MAFPKQKTGFPGAGGLPLPAAGSPPAMPKPSFGAAPAAPPFAKNKKLKAKKKSRGK